ncbi:MAG: arylsulfotransferase (ASST) [Phycisphaerales bacterium]|nr:arylsulfotransferase (ASST) [Phycisphaerales bacterium]
MKFPTFSEPSFLPRPLPVLALVATTVWLCSAAPADCPGDIDSSGTVDGSDLATLLGGWGTAGGAADIDGNGSVDGADLTMLLGGWGACQLPAQERNMVTLLTSTTTTALDDSATTVQSWTGAAVGASVAYLRPDGSLVRPCVHAAGAFVSAARGGRIQIFNPAGALINDLLVSTSEYQQHHDINVMPNGNILCIAWEAHTQAQGLAAGRTTLTGPIWPETILEIQPTGYSTFNIVWRWSLWNHLIQGVNPSLSNYGVVADHPELVNINYGTVGTSGDWIHANSIDYDATRDQIVMSSRNFNEIWVIDHSTTTAQAASHTGGNAGRGGDLLYRWGNPVAYGRGSSANQYFFTVHSATWINVGMPGAGNIMAFNNGDRTGVANDYSTVVELLPPRDASGNYVITAGQSFGPSAPAWTHGAAGAFYGGATQCGSFRTLDNTTLITLTNTGRVFEVTTSGTTIWEIDVAGQVARVPRYRLVDGLWIGP